MARDAYAELTDRILALLAEGTVPWRKPWSGGGAPVNFAGRPYRGINAVVLAVAGHADVHWATFNQVQKLGGRVRKGEHGTPIVFWAMLDKKRSAADPHEADASRPKRPAPAKGESPQRPAKDDRRVPLARLYIVFNAEQTDGLTPTWASEPARTFDPIERADFLTESVPNPPVIVHRGGRALYLPSADRIELPAFAAFTSPAAYYSTLFHELGHATGHSSRLGRPGVETFDHFGSGRYAREELVAELTAAFMCGEAGISPAVIENQAAYISSWSERLRADSRLVVQAAGQAQRAADYLLGRMATQHEEPAAA